MQNRKKGFTLIELLVVISIIALLLSILMPALAKVKKQGKTIVCKNLLRQMGIANISYAAGNKGFSVGTKDGASGGTYPVIYWPSNHDYLTILGLKPSELESLNSGYLGYIWPKQFLCPETQPNLPIKLNNEWKHQLSYGLNNDSYLWNEKIRIQLSSVKNPYNKVQFVDCFAWWVERKSANYFHLWDKFKYTRLREPGVADSIIPFGHNKECANVNFYDGRTDTIEKNNMYYYRDDRIGGYPDNSRMDSMWKLKY